MCQKKTIAFIIPLHLPKFKHIYNLKNKFNIINKCCDIYLVFSNENEYDKFIYKEYIKSIILPQGYETNNHVTFKKFYALNALKTQYMYYIVCDSEIDIIDQNFTLENIMTKINKFYNSKIIFAGEVKSNDVDIFTGKDASQRINSITETSCNILKNIDDKKKLKTLTNNYTLYYWWSDLPIYKGSHLDDFFNKINFNTILEPYHFDHKIYTNFLLLYHDFKFINITSLIGVKWSLESFKDYDINKLEKLKNNSYTFSWITYHCFHIHKRYFIENGSFLLYHLDRKH